jgi:hypothetical protein
MTQSGNYCLVVYYELVCTLFDFGFLNSCTLVYPLTGMWSLSTILSILIQKKTW